MAFADAQLPAVIQEASCPVKITLAGTVVRGDAIGYSTGWKPALATAGSVIQLRGVAGESGVSGDIITGFFGPCVLGGDDRFSDATPGGAVYVAEGSDSGQYTQTAPTTQSDADTQVGVAISATELLITPNVEADHVHA